MKIDCDRETWGVIQLFRGELSWGKWLDDDY